MLGFTFAWGILGAESCRGVEIVVVVSLLPCFFGSVKTGSKIASFNCHYD